MEQNGFPELFESPGERKHPVSRFSRKNKKSAVTRWMSHSAELECDGVEIHSHVVLANAQSLGYWRCCAAVSQHATTAKGSPPWSYGVLRVQYYYHYCVVAVHQIRCTELLALLILVTQK